MTQPAIESMSPAARFKASPAPARSSSRTSHSTAALPRSRPRPPPASRSGPAPIRGSPISGRATRTCSSDAMRPSQGWRRRSAGRVSPPWSARPAAASPPSCWPAWRRGCTATARLALQPFPHRHRAGAQPVPGARPRAGAALCGQRLRRRALAQHEAAGREPGGRRADVARRVRRLPQPQQGSAHPADRRSVRGSLHARRGRGGASSASSTCCWRASPIRRRARRPDICLILTLRADFYGRALRHRPLADALQGHVENLGPMNREELQAAIVRPGGKRRGRVRARPRRDLARRRRRASPAACRCCSSRCARCGGGRSARRSRARAMTRSAASRGAGAAGGDDLRGD